MADTFKIYKGEEMVVEGASPLTITGLAADTQVVKGDYTAVKVVDGAESAKVDIPAFKTLPSTVTGVTLTPKTSAGETGTAGSKQLSAAVAPGTATNKAVTYVIAPSDTGLSVSATGLIEWTDTTTANTYTTTVTTMDGSKKDTHVLTLTDPILP